jgi:hypothetical protein
VAHYAQANVCGQMDQGEALKRSVVLVTFVLGAAVERLQNWWTPKATTVTAECVGVSELAARLDASSEAGSTALLWRLVLALLGLAICSGYLLALTLQRRSVARAIDLPAVGAASLPSAPTLDDDLEALALAAYVPDRRRRRQ